MAEVIWTEPALDSLKAIVDYIAEDSLVYAERFAHNVVVAPRILAEYPQSGRVVPEYKDEAIRELIYGAYRIIYQIRGSNCYVVAVIHASRSLLRHLPPGSWLVD